MFLSNALWRNGDYLRFRAARLVSLLGSQLSWIAYPLLVLGLGYGAAPAGAVASCWLIARAAFRLPGGHAADKFDRRLLMLTMDVIRVVAVGTIPLTAALHGLSYPQLLVVAIIDSAGCSFFDPAATAIVRDIVPTENRTTAMSQSQAISASVSLIGPALGGLLYELGRMLPFIFDAASYALSALLLISIRIRPARTSGGGADRRMTAGLRWLWQRPSMVRVLIFVAVINFVGSATSVAVVVVLRERGVAAGSIGVVLACAGAGGVVGAALARRLIDWLGTRVYATIGVLWAVGFASVAVAPSAWVIGPVLVILFVCSPAAAVLLGTTTLSEVPRDLLGRVSTAQQLMASSLASVGPILAGLCLQAAGVAPTWLILAACCLAVTLYLAVPARAARPRSATAEDQPSVYTEQR